MYTCIVVFKDRLLRRVSTKGTTLGVSSLHKTRGSKVGNINTLSHLLVVCNSKIQTVLPGGYTAALEVGAHMYLKSIS